MRVKQRARLSQKQRWKPRLADIVRKTIKKNLPKIVANIAHNNSMFRRLMNS